MCALTKDTDQILVMGSSASTQHVRYNTCHSTGHDSNKTQPSGFNGKTKSDMTEMGRQNPSAGTKAEKEYQPSTKYIEFCKEKFACVRQSARILDPDTFTFSDTEKLRSCLKEMLYAYQLYFDAVEHFQRHEYEQFQRALCDVLLETKQLMLYVKILREVPKSADFKDANPNQIVILTVVMSMLHNCTDLSDTFAEAVMKTTIIRNVKEILDVNSQTYLDGGSQKQTRSIITSCHGILHNTSMRESNIPELRKHDIIPTLKPYLESKKEMIRLSTLATLANIVTEEECDVITAHAPVVSQLLKVVQLGCEDTSRRCNGWSCKECVLAIRQLARNDANKKLLVELNTLPILVRVASTGDEEEQRESVHAILQISFDEFARKQIEQDPESLVMNLIVQLKDSPNKQIADLSVKVLWNLREEFKNSATESFRNIVKELFTTNKSEDIIAKQHIMISYQSANREFLVRIKDRLKDKGYMVWMDVEQMSGDILETMAQGVENAGIVLVCFSRKYKESDFCRQEAQYAHKLKKPIIPVKMEDGYEADGWLGFMLASEYFVNFSGKYLVPPKTEEKIQDLFRQIERKWKTGMDLVDAAPTKVNQTAVVAETVPDSYASHGAMTTSMSSEHGSHSRPMFSTIRQWSQDNVKSWLKKNNLENCGFDNITGAEISLLSRMLLEAPDQLYKSLRHDLQIKTLVAKANFVWALEELIAKG